MILVKFAWPAPQPITINADHAAKTTGKYFIVPMLQWLDEMCLPWVVAAWRVLR